MTARMRIAIVLLLVACETHLQWHAGARTGSAPASRSSSSIGGAPAHDDTIVTCDGQGEHVCGTTCVMTGEPRAYGDTHNCGACNKQCAAGSVCYDRVCDTCPSNTTICDNAVLVHPGARDGTSYVEYTQVSVCADLSNDDGNCGKCNHACSQGLTCIQGHCER